MAPSEEAQNNNTYNFFKKKLKQYAKRYVRRTIFQLLSKLPLPLLDISKNTHLENMNQCVIGGSFIFALNFIKNHLETY